MSDYYRDYGRGRSPSPRGYRSSSRRERSYSRSPSPSGAGGGGGGYRGYDRGDRGYDRGDRGDRGYDRGDRGYDRGDRGYDRGDRYERTDRYDRYERDRDRYERERDRYERERGRYDVGRYGRSPPRARGRSPRPYYEPRRYRPDVAGPPQPSEVLGIFGLDHQTSEDTLQAIYSEYGTVVKVVIIRDRDTQLSRGFGFITMDGLEAAAKAIEATNGLEIDGRAVRVDYSATKRAHSPTPGRYMGRKVAGPAAGSSRGPPRRDTSRSPPPSFANEPSDPRMRSLS